MSQNEENGAAAQPNVQEQNQPTNNAVMMMPWFMSSSWVPKFTGEGQSISFSSWRTKVESYLRAQGLNPRQTIDFVLDALEGKAHRQVMLLSPTKRQSEATILSELNKLYGGCSTTSNLRANFFSCKQETGEGVEPFMLRLCELFAKWQRSDAGGTGPRDEVLKDQFVKGLKEGPMKIELERHLRRNPTLTFEEVATEATAVEREAARRDAWACQAYVAPVTTVAPKDSGSVAQPDWQEMRDSLRAELKQEVKEQVTLLGKTIIDEIRTQLLPELNSRVSYQPTPARRAAIREARPNQWDDQGRPICNDCRTAGHIQRNCPQRRSNSSNFQAPRRR